MGLDVYLYRYDAPLAEVQAVEAEYDRESNAAWEAVTGGKAYGDCTEAEKEEARTRCDVVKERLGLDECGTSKQKVKIEEPSAKYPDHLFKIGYFRSSYNESGIQRVVENLIGKRPLDYIFEPDDEYEILPDWSACKRRALDVLDELRRATADDSYRVTCVSHNIFTGPEDLPSSEHEAMEIFRAEQKRDSLLRSYSNKNGEFLFGSPMTVVGIIPGKRSAILGPNEVPCVYLVYEGDISSYVQSIEIVIETCDYVLALPAEQQSRMVLHWSA